jgi:hypothetical protein
MAAARVGQGVCQGSDRSLVKLKAAAIYAVADGLLWLESQGVVGFEPTALPLCYLALAGTFSPHWQHSRRGAGGDPADIVGQAVSTLRASRL